MANWAKYSAPAGRVTWSGVWARKFTAYLVGVLIGTPTGFLRNGMTERWERAITEGAIILVAIPPVNPSTAPIIAPLLRA